VTPSQSLVAFAAHQIPHHLLFLQQFILPTHFLNLKKKPFQQYNAFNNTLNNNAGKNLSKKHFQQYKSFDNTYPQCIFF
jgi:hypothetical protein